MKKGHDFKDYISPDSIEKHSDYLKLGGKFARVIYLKDYASFIFDKFVTKLTDQSRSMMLSIDIVPVTTDEAVREVERKMLGAETNITNWQRRQNANNNFSATVPYDMEQQRRETKEYMDNLTDRDQRMMLAVLTLIHLADTKKQLDADTDALLKVGADHVGIVEKVENGRVYTIESNTSDSCRQRSYPVGYYKILGYDVVRY